MPTRTSGTLVRVLAVAIAVTALTGAIASQAQGAIRANRVAGGLNVPAAFTFTPKGTIVYLERGTCEVRFLNPETGFDRRFFRIRGVNGSGERGALGVALHPKWPKQPFVYVYVTRRAGGSLRNQIVRIRARGDVGRGLTTIVSTPASSSPYHNGGRIAFGPDGKLFAIVGDGHQARNAQDLRANLRGKILRMNPDGSAPRSNPMIGGRRTRVFAYGIRNSFGFTFDPATGRLWETENGPECNDEINLVRRGGNYAWGPSEACPDTNQDGPAPRRLPKVTFPSPIGITGATFCDGCRLGRMRDGDLFFGACCARGLQRIALNAHRNDVVGNPVSVLGNTVYSMETAPNGRIFFSDTHAIYRLVPR